MTPSVSSLLSGLVCVLFGLAGCNKHEPDPPPAGARGGLVIAAPSALGARAANLEPADLPSPSPNGAEEGLAPEEGEGEPEEPAVPGPDAAGVPL